MDLVARLLVSNTSGGECYDNNVQLIVPEVMCFAHSCVVNHG